MVKFLKTTIVLAAISGITAIIFAQTNAVQSTVPTTSGARLSGFAPNAGGGFTPGAAGGFQQNPVSGFTPNAVGGFTPGAVSGFNTNPIGGYTPNPVTGFTPNAGGNFATNPIGGFAPVPANLNPNITFGVSNFPSSSVIVTGAAPPGTPNIVVSPSSVIVTGAIPTTIVTNPATNIFPPTPTTNF